MRGGDRGLIALALPVALNPPIERVVTAIDILAIGHLTHQLIRESIAAGGGSSRPAARQWKSRDGHK